MISRIDHDEMIDSDDWDLDVSRRRWLMPQTSPSDLPKVQRVIRELPSVAHARVTWPEPRGPAHLEISLKPGSDDAEATRRILDVLEDVGRVDVSSLELIADKAPAERRARPTFVGIKVSRSELQTAVEVTFDVEGERIRGRADGLASYQHSTHTAAAAALTALRELLPPGVGLQLEWLEIIESRGHRPGVVQVAVATLTPKGQWCDIGSAFVRDDLRESAVRATLDAVNRRLGMLIDGDQ